jgi:hypothetical protein
MHHVEKNVWMKGQVTSSEMESLKASGPWDQIVPLHLSPSFVFSPATSSANDVGKEKLSGEDFTEGMLKQVSSLESTAKLFIMYHHLWKELMVSALGGHDNILSLCRKNADPPTPVPSNVSNPLYPAYNYIPSVYADFKPIGQ